MMSADTDKCGLHPPSAGSRADRGAAAPSPSASDRSLSLRSLPSIFLGVVCLWAIVQLFVLRVEESEEEGHEEIDRPGSTMFGAVETGEQSPPRTIDGERLLAVRVLRESLSVEALSKEVLRPGEATIVNFWATFCSPCKDELPLLRSLTAGLGAPMLHFVPVLVDDQVRLREARAMYDGLRGPSPSEFVSDGRLPDADDPRLTELQSALGGRVSLPTTVVLDCEGGIRWSRTRRLEPEDFEELHGVLDRVISELDTPTCVEERRRARRLQQARGQEDPAGTTTAGERLKPRSVCKADGVCDADRGETVKSCPVDCKPTIQIPSIGR